MIAILMRHQALMQLIRYGVMGVSINLAGYLLYLLITHLGMPPKLTMSLLYMAGVMAGFFGHRKWTFIHDGHATWALVRYFVAHAIGYGINLLLLIVLTDTLGYPHQAVQAAAIFVVAGFLFVMFKFFVFPVTRNPKA